MDKKSKEQRGNLDDDLDAMLDKAESSLFSSNEFQDDEDAIDRLLMNAGFDAEDGLMGTELTKDVNVVEDIGSIDLSNSEGFSEPPAAVDEIDTSQNAVDEDDDLFGLADNFDELDVLQDEPVEPSALAEADLSTLAADEESDAGKDLDTVAALDDFSDFSDFNEPEIVLPSSPQVDEPDLPETAVDDDLFDLNDDLADVDMIHSELVEPPVPVSLSESSFDDDADVEEQVAVDIDDEDAEPSDDEENDFFKQIEAQLAEAEMLSSQANLEVANIGTQAIAEASNGEVQAEVVGMNDSEQLTEDAEPSDDEEDDFSKQIEAQLAEAEMLSTQAAAEASGVEDQTAAVAEPDDFTDFSDFGEPEIVVPGSSEAVSSDESEQLADDTESSDEDDDFSKQIKAQLAEAEMLSTQAAVAQSFDDDEDDFDSLFSDDDFAAEEAAEQTSGKNNELENDGDLSEIDDFFQLDEVSDDFSKPIDEQLAEAGNSSNQDNQEDDFLLPDFDITADIDVSDTEINQDEAEVTFADTDFLNEDDALETFEPEVTATPIEKVEEPAPKPAEEVESTILSPFGFEQEDIKKQLEAAQNTVKKTRILTYVALGFGAVALSSAVGLGVIAYKAKGDVTKLTETVSTLEASLATIAANNPNEEINTMMSSVVQLNQQVYGFIAELKGSTQLPVDLLDDNVSKLVVKQDLVSKALSQLQVKMGGLEQKTLPSIVEQPKLDDTHQQESAKEENTHEITPSKVETAQESAPIAKEVGHQIAVPKEKHNPEIEPAKAETKHVTALAKLNAKPDPAAAKVEEKFKAIPVKVQSVAEIAETQEKTQPIAKIAKPLSIPKAVVKQKPEKIKIPQASGAWGVNLVAFKQEWFAKSKAAEFARKGVFAEVVPVPGNMYRLRVGGFKSKAEANANKERIKNTLNLESVWVSDN